MKASTPEACPDSTSALNARRLGSPLAASQVLPPIGTRHHMHQQPPQAPFAPNNVSISGQSWAVNERVTTSGDGV